MSPSTSQLSPPLSADDAVPSTSGYNIAVDLTEEDDELILYLSEEEEEEPISEADNFVDAPNDEVPTMITKLPLQK